MEPKPGKTSRNLNSRFPSWRNKRRFPVSVLRFAEERIITYLCLVIEWLIIFLRCRTITSPWTYWTTPRAAADCSAKRIMPNRRLSMSNRTKELNDNYLLLETFKEMVVSWMKEAVVEVLNERESQQSPVYPEKVGINQASEITGYSRNSLYQMHSKGLVPGAMKLGGKLLFDTATLRKWVEEAVEHNR